MEFVYEPSQADRDIYELVATKLQACLGNRFVSMFAYGAAFFERPSSWKTDEDPMRLFKK